MDKKRKRVHEDPHITQPREFSSISKPQNYEQFLISNSFNGHEDKHHKEPVVVDPYEAAVLQLPVAVRERLLRILRLGIATRYDIEVESLANLAELPESKAISVLDQFMLSGADQHDKGAYLVALISKYQVVDNLGVNQLPLSLSRIRDTNGRDSAGLSGRVQLPAVDPLALHVDPSVPRSDSYASRYSSLYPDYRLLNHASVVRTEERSPLQLHEVPGSSTTSTYNRYLANSHVTAAYANMEEMSPNPAHQIPGSSSTAYAKPAQDFYRIPTTSVGYEKTTVDPHLAPSADGPATRPQMRFDPFTGQPYKFDPFTGEPIVPESLSHRYDSPY